MKTYLAGFTAAIAAPVAFASPASAQSQMPAQFVAEFTAESPGEEHVAERGEPLLTISMRPELAVELTSVPDARMQRRIGVSEENPLEIGTRLYGSSNRSSLYCHIINERVVATGGTCLRDFDNDGAFEQGVKLEAPGLETDVVILANNGQWYGGTFVDRERLDPALTYRPVPREDVQTYPARVIWSANVRRPDPEDYPVRLTFSILAGEEGTNSNVIGRCRYDTLYSGSPVTFDFYGNTFVVHGFTEDGDMRFTVDPAPEETTIGLVYQFESRSAYVSMALNRNRRDLPCTDAEATDGSN